MIQALLALALAAPAARAQDDSILRTEGTDCGENAIPIAGTSGFSNARHALRTTAQTYSATNYAEQKILPHVPEDEEKGGAAAIEFFQMIKAAEVPTYEARAGSEGCPANYRVSVRPVDLQAMAMGGAFKTGNFAFFYAASVAYGNTSMPNNYVRGMLLFAQPIYAMSTLFMAPLIRNGFTTQQGASAFALDWVAGATYSTSFATARVGYAGSRGLYASAAEHKLGLFASGLLGGANDTGGALGYVKTGIDRLSWGHLFNARAMGLTSLYLRDLPFGVAPAASLVEESQGLLGDAGRLQTLHFAQDNLAQRFDLGATLARRPEASLYDATVALHSPGFNPARDVGETTRPGGDDVAFSYYLGAGVVDLPGQATLGIEGARKLHARVEIGAEFGDDEIGGRGSMALLLNDPEVLALYPYAIDAITFRYSVEGEF